MPRKVLTDRQTQKSGESTLDAWFLRLSSISQIGLLVLGLFGYFYTVVPVFQNQQLQEQAAKLQLENEAQETRLKSLARQRESLDVTIAQLKRQAKSDENRSAVLAQDIASANWRQHEARQRAEKAEATLQKQLAFLNVARWGLARTTVLSEYASLSIVSELGIPTSDFTSKSVHDSGGFIFNMGKKWPDPYKDLLSAIDDAAQIDRRRYDIPGSYFDELKNYVVGRRKDLICEKPDLNAMHAKYLSDIGAIRPEVDAELDRYIDGIRKTYASKGEPIEITSNFRASARSAIRANKINAVNAEYIQNLTGRRIACNKKAFDLLSSLEQIDQPLDSSARSR